MDFFQPAFSKLVICTAKSIFFKTLTFYIFRHSTRFSTDPRMAQRKSLHLPRSTGPGKTHLPSPLVPSTQWKTANQTDLYGQPVLESTNHGRTRGARFVGLWRSTGGPRWNIRSVFVLCKKCMFYRVELNSNNRYLPRVSWSPLTCGELNQSFIDFFAGWGKLRYPADLRDLTSFR